MPLDLVIAVLLVTGLALMTLEAVAPSFGVLGVGGVVAFFAALALLRQTGTLYGYAVDLPVLVALGLAGVVVLAASLYYALKARRVRISAGVEMIDGMAGRVVTWSGAQGRVHVDGEVWAARGPEGLAPDDIVVVQSRDHLVLNVTKGIS